MANRFCNLDGNAKIKDEYGKINIGFDKVENEIDDLNSNINAVDNRVNEIITTPVEGVSAQEIIDARHGEPTLGAKIADIEHVLDAHKAESALDDVHGLLAGGKVIQESGSNVNGRYVRFADGTQICYINASLTGLSTSEYGNLSMNYPAKFTGVNVAISVSLMASSAGKILSPRYTNSTTLATGVGVIVYFDLNNHTFTSNDKLSLTAVGRWK